MSGLYRKMMVGLFDIVAAGVLVSGNYIYNYKLPQSMSPLGNRESVCGRTAAVMQNFRKEDLSEGAWKSKFSDYFSEETEITDVSYSSPNVAVSVEKKTCGTGADTITYFVADIHIADISCFHTGFAQDTYGIGYREGLEEMSDRFGAVLAIDGDSYSTDRHQNNGTIIREGIVYRNQYTKYDTCVLYYDGTMRTFTPEEFDLAQAIKDGAYQTWVFGPSLLDENGKRKTEFNIWDYIKETHPRAAIGYYEPGHYCMVLVDGRQEEEQYSRGMLLEELSAVFEELGCSVAYNLDGGHCAVMTLNGKIANQPYELSKDICDCIYISEPQGGHDK